jgi:tubulin alpha
MTEQDKSMREVIWIHVGGAGCRLGMAFWARLLQEHGMAPDGAPGVAAQARLGVGESVEAFFQEGVLHGRLMPRALFLDLEPSAVDALRVGPYRTLFHPEQFVHGQEDAAGVYARAAHPRCQHLVDLAMTRIRYMAEQCRSLQGFILTHGIGGGAGAGLTSLLVERLARDYGEQAILTFTAWPAAQHIDGSPVTAPYNTVLASAKLIEHASMVVPLDNQAVSVLCQPQSGAEPPTLAQLNDKMARMMLAITEPLRKRDAMETCVRDLVPSSERKFVHPLAAAQWAKADEEVSRMARLPHPKALLGATLHRFEQMLTRKAFVHWYTREGMEEATLNGAREAVHKLVAAFEGAQ